MHGSDCLLTYIVVTRICGRSIHFMEFIKAKGVDRLVIIIVNRTD